MIADSGELLCNHGQVVNTAAQGIEQAQQQLWGKLCASKEYVEGCKSRVRAKVEGFRGVKEQRA